LRAQRHKRIGLAEAHQGRGAQSDEDRRRVRRKLRPVDDGKSRAGHLAQVKRQLIRGIAVNRRGILGDGDDMIRRTVTRQGEGLNGRGGRYGCCTGDSQQQQR